eukprot:GILK01004721.1.p1 GENE.GILK01004721.1~~GILK01004721.1.p1  ORF type:complete len:309 (+),score=41.13 GILK01004721.1:71-997(+)
MSHADQQTAAETPQTETSSPQAANKWQQANGEEPTKPSGSDSSNWPTPGEGVEYHLVPVERIGAHTKKKSNKKGKANWVKFDQWQTQHTSDTSASSTPASRSTEPRPAELQTDNEHTVAADASSQHAQPASPVQNQGIAMVSGGRGGRGGRGRGGYRGGGGYRGRGGRGGFYGAAYVPMGQENFYGYNPYYSYYPAQAVDKSTIQETIQKQIEYYFSVDNLCKDMFLRTQMDEQGFVKLTTLANFNRVRQLADLTLLTESLSSSPVIELDAEKTQVRKREGWQYWLLPKNESSSVSSSDASVPVSAQS